MLLDRFRNSGNREFSESLAFPSRVLLSSAGEQTIGLDCVFSRSLMLSSNSPTLVASRKHTDCIIHFEPRCHFRSPENNAGPPKVRLTGALEPRTVSEAPARKASPASPQALSRAYRGVPRREGRCLDTDRHPSRRVRFSISKKMVTSLPVPGVGSVMA
jgi:hypothetical protein